MSPVPMKRCQRGFTLIELLVVIGIISILIAATLTIIPKVQRAVAGASTSAQLAALATAIQQYYNDYRAYPGPLANNQLNSQYDANANLPGAQGFPLEATAPFSNNNYNPAGGSSTTWGSNITGSQNLVLGLLGGLQFQYNNGAVSGFVYKPDDLLTDGVNPAPKGPASLNPNLPRRQQSYIQVKNGELSTPMTSYGTSGASFADTAGRYPADAMIPVFLDKYSNPLPILYYRTNVGGTAIVGLRSKNTPGQYVADSSTALVDINGNAETPQYDLTQNLPYVQSVIGTKGNTQTNPTNNPSSTHGLKGVTDSSNESGQLLVSASTPPTPPVDTIDYSLNGVSVPTGANNGAKYGYNGLSYFKDPTLNSTAYDGATSNTSKGVARQKDGFVLISAGPDRLYGTHDDLIYPGPLQP